MYILSITPFSSLDRPIVEQEQTFIHTSGTDRMEVVCTVHASPKAKVCVVQCYRLIDYCEFTKDIFNGNSVNTQSPFRKDFAKWAYSKNVILFRHWGIAKVSQ